jgi:alanine dehydrogenase
MIIDCVQKIKHLEDRAGLTPANVHKYTAGTVLIPGAAAFRIIPGYCCVVNMSGVVTQTAAQGLQLRVI